MRVTLAATGKFHFLDLANQMARTGALDRFYTAYPHWKLPSLQLPRSAIHSYPWVHTPYMAMQRMGAVPPKVMEAFDWVDREVFDAHVARDLRPCDVYTAISGCGLLSGARAKALGGRYVCDRGSTHIRYQNRILKEEHDHWGLPFTPTHPRIVDRELSEYEQADLITVPSRYAKQTFVSEGVRPEKITVIPYGVDLTSFAPVAQPEIGSFNVAYVGGVNLRKGIQYLVQAFAKVTHPRKALWLIGQVDRRFVTRLRKLGLIPTEAVFLGHVDQTQLQHHLGRASVLVLPSVEDGFGLVMAQALACGCPVIASAHTGAAEIINEDENGYIVPARNAEALTKALQRIADTPDDTHQMRSAACESVQKVGGWRQYGDQVLRTYQSLCGAA